MVRGQYIDTVKWVETTETTFDENGLPIVGTTTEFENNKCRYENFMKGGNRLEYVNKNGESILATGAIYFKGKGAIVPKRFDNVKLFLANASDGVEPIEVEILSINYGQFNKVAYVCQRLM